MNIIKTIVSSFVVTGALSAQVYTFDDLGAAPGTPIATLPGWTESEPSLPDSPLGWVGVLDGSAAGSVGAYYGVPAANDYSVFYASSFGLSGAKVSFDFAISDFTDYAFRDEFTFGVHSGADTLLAGLVLTPLAANNPASDDFGWNLSYTVAGVGTIDTLLQLQAGNLYSITMNFEAGSFELVVGNSSGSYSFTTGAAGYNVSTDVIGGLSFGVSKLDANPDFGDGFIVFDNISVVPEPSAAAAWMAVVGLSFAASRRRSVRV